MDPSSPDPWVKRLARDMLGSGAGVSELEYTRWLCRLALQVQAVLGSGDSTCDVESIVTAVSRACTSGSLDSNCLPTVVPVSRLFTLCDSDKGPQVWVQGCASAARGPYLLVGRIEQEPYDITLDHPVFVFSDGSASIPCVFPDALVISSFLDHPCVLADWAYVPAMSRTTLDQTLLDTFETLGYSNTRISEICAKPCSAYLEVWSQDLVHETRGREVISDEDPTPEPRPNMVSFEAVVTCISPCIEPVYLVEIVTSSLVLPKTFPRLVRRTLPEEFDEDVLPLTRACVRFKLPRDWGLRGRLQVGLSFGFYNLTVQTVNPGNGDPFPMLLAGRRTRIRVAMQPLPYQIQVQKKHWDNLDCVFATQSQPCTLEPEFKKRKVLPKDKRQAIDLSMDYLIHAYEYDAVKAGSNVGEASAGLGARRLALDSDQRVITYVGTITRYLGQNVYLLDNKVLLYMSHRKVPCYGRGWRIGATLRIGQAHLVYKGDDVIGIGCCFHSTTSIMNFSSSTTNGAIPIVPHCDIQSQHGHLFSLSDLRAFRILYSDFVQKFKDIWSPRGILPWTHSYSDDLDTPMHDLGPLFVCLQACGFTPVTRDEHLEFLQHSHHCQLGTKQLNYMSIPPLSQLAQRLVTLVPPLPQKSRGKGKMSWKHHCLTSTEISRRLTTTFVVGRLAAHAQSGRLQLQDATGGYDVVVSGLQPGHMGHIYVIKDYSFILEHCNGTIISYLEFDMSTAMLLFERTVAGAQCALAFPFQPDIYPSESMSVKEQGQVMLSSILSQEYVNRNPALFYVAVTGKGMVTAHPSTCQNEAIVTVVVLNLTGDEGQAPRGGQLPPGFLKTSGYTYHQSSSKSVNDFLSHQSDIEAIAGMGHPALVSIDITMREKSLTQYPFLRIGSCYVLSNVKQATDPSGNMTYYMDASSKALPIRFISAGKTFPSYDDSSEVPTLVVRIPETPLRLIQNIRFARISTSVLSAHDIVAQMVFTCVTVPSLTITGRRLLPTEHVHRFQSFGLGSSGAHALLNVAAPEGAATLCMYIDFGQHDAVYALGLIPGTTIAVYDVEFSRSKNGSHPMLKATSASAIEIIKVPNRNISSTPWKQLTAGPTELPKSRQHTSQRPTFVYSLEMEQAPDIMLNDIVSLQPDVLFQSRCRIVSVSFAVIRLVCKACREVLVKISGICPTPKCSGNDILEGNVSFTISDGTFRCQLHMTGASVWTALNVSALEKLLLRRLALRHGPLIYDPKVPSAFKDASDLAIISEIMSAPRVCRDIRLWGRVMVATPVEEESSGCMGTVHSHSDLLTFTPNPLRIDGTHVDSISPRGDSYALLNDIGRILQVS